LPAHGEHFDIRIVDVRPVPIESIMTAQVPAAPPPGTIPLRRNPVDLVRLVSSTLEPLAHEARGLDVTLTIEGPPDLQRVSVDPDKIAWVVATLVGNALRYVRRGTLRLPGGDIAVRILRDERQTMVAISVTDDGPGIPADTRSRLFSRQAGSQHAVGLGLSLVKDIVEAHGGSVSVESREDYADHGTKVRLTLPIA